MLGEDSGEGKSRKRVKRKGKSDLIDRMLSSYRKRKRAKKLQRVAGSLRSLERTRINSV